MPVYRCVISFRRISFGLNRTQDSRPGAFSAVPAGLFVLSKLPRTYVLGYFQPSLRDCFVYKPYLSGLLCVQTVLIGIVSCTNPSYSSLLFLWRQGLAALLAHPNLGIAFKLVTHARGTAGAADQHHV